MSSPQQNQTNDLVTAAQVMAALEGYRHLFAAQDIGKASDFTKPVTVYMGGQDSTWQPFYREATTDTPGIQKLNESQLKFLEWVTQKPAQDAQQEDPLHKQNGNLRIDLGEQTVFTMVDGYVRYNALKDHVKGQENAQIQPGGGWPNAPGAKKIQQTVEGARTAGEGVPPVAASQSSPQGIQPVAIEEATVLPTVATTAAPVSPGKGLSSRALSRYLTRLEVQIPEPTATDFAKSRVDQTRWQAAQYEQLSNQNKRILTVAHALLKQYGVAEGQQLVYQAEGYTLEADAKTIRISSGFDLSDEPLFEAKKTFGTKYKVTANNLTPDQILDFNKVDFLLEKVGVKGLNPDPRLRKQQLEALAPQGDKAVAQDLTSHALAKTAERFLNHLKVQPNAEGERQLSGHYYTIKQKGETLKIIAANRGVILNVGPKINSNSVTPKDITYFRSLAQRHLLGRGIQRKGQITR